MIVQCNDADFNLNDAPTIKFTHGLPVSSTK